MRGVYKPIADMIAVVCDVGYQRKETLLSAHKSVT